MEIRPKVTVVVCLVLASSLWMPNAARTQENREVGPHDAPRVNAVGDEAAAARSVKAIDREFAREILRLERWRLERLAELAARQPRAEAETTYEAYLSSAAGRGLFQEAEPVAEKLIEAGGASPRVTFLAHAVNIIAEVKRGDYEGSLASLAAALQDARRGRENAGRAAPLPLPERLALLELYYQGLIQADRFDIARKALAMIREVSQEPAVRDSIDNRLARLAMLGRPAPAIEGTDVDGKPFRLAGLKGSAVLIVFWASWDLPDAREVEAIKELDRTHRGQGLRIVGINLDALQDGVRDTEAVEPQVRRFLLEHNVTWPNLIDGRGGRGIARAYGVTEVPANFLVGRDGTILHFDLTRANRARVIARALSR